jgi:hypothetical protein
MIEMLCTSVSIQRISIKFGIGGPYCRKKLISARIGKIYLTLHINLKATLSTF